MRVLVGGVGYRFLRDGSIGPWFADRLAPPGANGVEVEVEDLSYHPVGLSQNLQERPDYDRVVLIAAGGGGPPPGTIGGDRWGGGVPGRDAIPARGPEAGGGGVSPH